MVCYKGFFPSSVLYPLSFFERIWDCLYSCSRFLLLFLNDKKAQSYILVDLNIVVNIGILSTIKIQLCELPV